MASPGPHPPNLDPVRWTIHGERTLYDSEWLRLVLVDIEVPGGERFDHHAVRYPQPAAGTIVVTIAVVMSLFHLYTAIAGAWPFRDFPIIATQPRRGS